MDQLDRLHVADGPGTERGHRLAERLDQVLRPIGDVRRAEQDPLERAAGAHLDRVPRGSVGDGAAMPQFVPRPGASSARASGEPSISASAPAATALASLAAAAHPAVGDDRHVAPGLRVVRVACRGDVADRGHLRDADPEHLARRACRARPDADEDGGRACAISWNAASALVVLPTATGIGMKRVNSASDSGSYPDARWRADETWLWTRNRSAHAQRRTARTGGRRPVSATAAGEPAAWISSMRRAIRSSRMGAW